VGSQTAHTNHDDNGNKAKGTADEESNGCARALGNFEFLVVVLCKTQN